MLTERSPTSSIKFSKVGTIGTPKLPHQQRAGRPYIRLDILKYSLTVRCLPGVAEATDRNGSIRVPV